ncbi:MAG TPA: aspartyl protease family protein [Chitinophagaceae bacterium]|nr:aspartyl protease family protein [Chitinophagaceae bacterium]
MKRSLPVLLLVLSCLFSGLGTAAQEEFTEPNSRLITRFPFRMLTGGVILIRGTFADHTDSLNFVFDTGSGGISLDSSVAERYHVKKVPSDKTIRGIAGMRTVSFVYDQVLHLPGLTIDSLNFHINDYAILTSVYGEPIDGIIGYSVLSRYIIRLDYDSSIISFYSRGPFKYPRGGYLLRPVITTLPVQAARIRDTRNINSRFLFDMGAGLCLMLTTDFVRDSSVLGRKAHLYAKQAEGLGGRVEMATTVIREVKIGPYRFRRVPIYIFEDTYNVTSYPYLGGILGNDLLRRFNVILNYEKKDIYLMPNSHFRDPFDYSYSGLELYYVGGKILIGDVAQGSPAEKAGLKEGDVVIAINNLFNQNLSQYKAALQVAGQRIKLVIRRNGELRTIEFKVRSIF